MSENPRRNLMIPGILIGFGIAVILGLALIPMLDCPHCREWDFSNPRQVIVEKLASIVDCDVCDNRGKVPVLKKLFYRLQH